MLELTTSSPDQTLALGMRLAGLMRAGDVVLLNGRLGSGKTLLTSGIAGGLGVDDPVTSPTFVIVRHYEGFLGLTHADMYRLGSTGEFDDLDLIRQAADGVLVIEWGAPVAALVGADHLAVDIEVVGEEARKFVFRPSGRWCGRDLEELKA